MAYVINPPLPAFTEEQKSNWELTISGGTFTSSNDIGPQTGSHGSPIQPALTQPVYSYSFGSTQEFGGVTNTGIFTGSGVGSRNNAGNLHYKDRIIVVPGTPVTLTGQVAVHGYPGGDGDNDRWLGGLFGIEFFDATGSSLGKYYITRRFGTVQGDPSGSETIPRKQWSNAILTRTAPSNAYAFTIFAATIGHNAHSTVFLDITNLTYTSPSATIRRTPSGQILEDQPFTLHLNEYPGEREEIQAVEYFIDNSPDPDESLGTSVTGPNFSFTSSIADEGEYELYGEIDLGNNVKLRTSNLSLLIGPLPPPITREFKASNAYTNLVLENFQGLSSHIPDVATVVGTELLVDYTLSALIRSKDKDTDVEYSNPDVLFEIVPRYAFDLTFYEKNDSEYTPLGNVLSTEYDLTRSDFTVTEEATSEGKLWTVMQSVPLSEVMGSETNMFANDPMVLSDFINKVIGIRFRPILAPLPDYADSGDACIRVNLDNVRLRVYFDAGSVEYYFASPERDMVIKGTLVAANTLGGNFASGDASGMLQLHSELEIVEGDQEWIGNDWTIHAAYPPTDANRIGDVASFDDLPDVGMRYNGLPTQQQVRDNRSRYVMITANFYGDKDLNSIYGANGLSRAFAHNGRWFYKIYTNPEDEKDMPRHVAYHHWHLALGYEEGRVDISVVGEPFNFDGALGASSWTIGDKVVGLLPLSGTILGVFGSKSVWGIAGTTVDNFATQVISPNIGATEYTICDMGFPVYANAYGIYTLSQTQQYGDYLGTPMSQDVSPWLRPRLVRKYTTDREVEVAWPVRHKNQYRLAFSDGYVLSMTMNGQAVPTFSKQKYFLPPENVNVFSEGAQFQGVGS